MPPRNSSPTDRWELFKQALIAKEETRPDGTGWLTFKEMLNKLGMKPGKLRKVLSQNQGTYEFFNGYVSKSGKLVRCVWYRPKL